MGNSLITSPVYVQTPYVKVTIGNYTFGVYDRSIQGMAKYPNYIQSLDVEKINGQFNTYRLNIVYPINQDSDPNYFEKVFSSVSQSRYIKFSYGDVSASNFLYKEEEGIIVKIGAQFDLDNAKISYTVEAVSRACLTNTGNYSFPATFDKPSNVIKRILKDSRYGLQDLFTGMRSDALVQSSGLIPNSDVAVQLERQDNITPLQYLQYLVDSMTPSFSSADKSDVYVLTFVDDTTDNFGGSYFKIVKVDTKIEHPEAYQLDIGYPGSNYVFNFTVEQDDNYSVFYDYQKTLHPQEFVSRINQDGDYEEVFAPILMSSNAQHKTTEADKAWWAKVTAFPIKASLKIKGLLRPAILMSYVRVNIHLYGQEQTKSGLYIITKQTDSISGANGYTTTLNMVRIAGA